jgi:hypothetical protein
MKYRMDNSFFMMIEAIREDNVCLFKESFNSIFEDFNSSIWEYNYGNNASNFIYLIKCCVQNRSILCTRFLVKRGVISSIEDDFLPLLVLNKSLKIIEYYLRLLKPKYSLVNLLQINESFEVGKLLVLYCSDIHKNEDELTKIDNDQILSFIIKRNLIYFHKRKGTFSSSLQQLIQTEVEQYNNDALSLMLTIRKLNYESNSIWDANVLKIVLSFV